MAYKLSEINAAVRRDPVGFMEECDQGYQDKIGRVVEWLNRNFDQ